MIIFLKYQLLNYIIIKEHKKLKKKKQNKTKINKSL